MALSTPVITLAETFKMIFAVPSTLIVCLSVVAAWMKPRTTISASLSKIQDVRTIGPAVATLLR